MFVAPKPTPIRRGYALLASAALHLFALAALLHRPAAIFVHPSFVAEGRGGKSASVVYLVHPGEEETSPPERARLTLPKPARPASKHQVKASRQRPQNAKPAESFAQLERAGSPFGSVPNGLADGHEVRPALPLVFPEPVVSRSEIPQGVDGSVIVEITIDTQGNVIETRLVRGLGPGVTEKGIEDKVIAAVRNWRFKPATQDGVAIASQQDVSFHFPS